MPAFLQLSEYPFQSPKSSLSVSDSTFNLLDALANENQPKILNMGIFIILIMEIIPKNTLYLSAAAYTLALGLKSTEQLT